MFAFRQIDPNTQLSDLRWDVPINEWLGLKWAQGRADTLGVAYERFLEDLDDDPPISAELANERYALPTLKFDSPISDRRASLMHERKKRELAILAQIDAAEFSNAHPKTWAGVGASIVGNFSHTTDFASLFLPIVGWEAKAAGLAKLGASTLRQRVARGFITHEQIIARGVSPRMAPYVGTFLEGSISSAITEIPVFLQKQRDQAIYGPEDAAINVLAGGLFSSGIHAAVRGLHSALEHAGNIFQRLSPAMRDAITMRQIDNFLTDRPMDVSAELRLDDSAIEAKARFNEQAAVDAEGITSRPEAPEPPVRQQALARERQRSAEEFFAKNHPTRIAEERQKALMQEHSETKLLSDEDIQRYGTDTVEVEKATTAAKEDATSIRQDIEAANQRQLAELDDVEQKAATKERLDKEIKMVEEAAYKPKDEAIDVAVDCILSNL